MADCWDYIIVGAGSAGCVLAERLSADAQSAVDPQLRDRGVQGLRVAELMLADRASA